MSQKTYEVDSPIICVCTDDVLVAEKRLRYLLLVPQPICFQEE